MTTEKEHPDQARDDEAQDPDREGGVGPPETPPGQAKPRPDQDLPEEPDTPEAEPKEL